MWHQESSTVEVERGSASALVLRWNIQSALTDLTDIPPSDAAAPPKPPNTPSPVVPRQPSKPDQLIKRPSPSSVTVHLRPDVSAMGSVKLVCPEPEGEQAFCLHKRPDPSAERLAWLLPPPQDPPSAEPLPARTPGALVLDARTPAGPSRTADDDASNPAQTLLQSSRGELPASDIWKCAAGAEAAQRGLARRRWHRAYRLAAAQAIASVRAPSPTASHPPSANASPVLCATACHLPRSTPVSCVADALHEFGRLLREVPWLAASLPTKPRSPVIPLALSSEIMRLHEPDDDAVSMSSRNSVSSDDPYHPRHLDCVVGLIALAEEEVEGY